MQEEPYLSDLRQLKTYMSILDYRIGKLFYIFLGSTDNIYFKEYLVTLDDREKEQILEKLEDGA